MFALRVRTSNLVLRFGLWILPNGRYKDELLLAMYDLKAKAAWYSLSKIHHQ